MVIRDLKRLATIRIEACECVVGEDCMYVELGREGDEGGYAHLDAADRQWLREELAKWDHDLNGEKEGKKT